MNYHNYMQIVSDLNYACDLKDHDKFYHSRIDGGVRQSNKIKKMYLDHCESKYENTKNTKTPLGKFLKQFPLKAMEFLCLISLVEDINDQSDFERMSFIKTSQDMFKKFKVRYESSQLRRWKLIYRIINPLRPMKAVYEVSYKAQLALKGQKYTDEYKQLDLALEEESKKNSPDALDSLYYIIDPKSSFHDLVANDTLKNNLKAAMARDVNKDKIFKKWGFNKVIPYGQGTTLNFRGPPGTGKTLAAHCLAKELKKKLLMVRYDQLQSKWVGESEKHIQRVFALAKSKNAVLFFDEADAIALSRASLEKSWEMSQVNTLLKELERFDGVCIFATNFADKYDEAFQRRLTMHIDFKLPEKEQAYLILDKVFPKRSREKNLDFSKIDLTGLSGGDIKNIALNAAGIAAKDDSKKINISHIHEAVQIVRNGKTTPTCKINFIG